MYENYKRMLDLIEMNRLSGRLPVASTRRLSASISSSQRPHSSYSLNVNSSSSASQNSDEASSNNQSPVQQTQPPPQQQQQQQQPQPTYQFDHALTPTTSNTSLLIRKQDSSDMVVLRNHLTDQLKCMLLNKTGGNSGIESNSIANGWTPPSVMAPISVSTHHLMSKSMHVTASDGNDAPLHTRILSNAPSFELLRDKSMYFTLMLA